MMTYDDYDSWFPNGRKKKEKRKKNSKSYLIKINCKDLRVLFESWKT